MCLSCCERIEKGYATIDPCLCGSPQAQIAMQRIEADLSRRQFIGGSAAVVGMFAGFGLAPLEVRAQTPGRPTVLTNLRFFDGTTLEMQSGRDIVIEGGRITGLPAVGTGPTDADLIDCGGRAVMPGLIDCHWHATLVSVSQIAALTQDIAFVHLVAGQEAGATLMRGFTTIRDLGGPVFGLKLAIDNGVVSGPRIFPSGAMISQPGGHGDFRLLNTLPRMPGDAPDYTESTGVAAIADGADEVLRRAREQLMKGASQVKIMAGGGVTSIYDPLDTAQYLLEEMEAAVRAAANWGTYVSAHVYNPQGIQRSLRAGVKSIEHGQLADLESVQMMREEGAWWSIQPFLQDEDSNPRSNPIQQQKAEEVARGTVQAFAMGRSEGVNMAFGTDILMNLGASQSQGRQLAKLTRFMPPLEALRMATGHAGDLLALSGPRDPYQGRLGVIAEGAHADILVWDGDPETDLNFLDNPGSNLRLIMKGGRVFKETL
ncbi:MAG: hydrolase [Rhodobacteraceae bacterium CG17_big_fil_post_rev_8_21_14_2_50_65_11]|nr:MAG: hydrolase [Rhodobacteraceae bacterium CG17_big_fil_post_rev_8_21_14_2_50_65_11]